jgi:phosphate transport system substrate-binding protein
LKPLNLITTGAACAALALGAAACGGDDEPAAGGNGAENGEQASNLSGTIRIDGSSTVAPLSEAAAELFQEQNPDVRVSVGTSGTGGGFEKFCRGETDVADASREIEEDEEKACAGEGIEFEEVTVANDALTVVVNQDNDWAECLSVSEVNKIWRPQNPAENWSEVRDGFPDERIERYGPGTDSGTFDYFTEAINGEEGEQTTSYNNVGEDDNATVTGVSGSKGGIGYFGFSFFEENQNNLKAAQISEEDGGDCVTPSPETAQDGSYKPLGRQLFIYPSDKALEKEAVQAFVKFYIEENDQIAERAGFIPLTDEQKEEAQQKVDSLASAGGGSGTDTGTSTTE